MAFFRDSVAPSQVPRPSTPSNLHRYFQPYSVLQPCFPAINVLFAMRENCPIIIPPEVPEPQAIALREFRDCRTPLFADAIPRDNFSASFTLPGRSKSHGPEFHRLFGQGWGTEEDSHPGAFSGLWRGSMMVRCTLVGVSEWKVLIRLWVGLDGIARRSSRRWRWRTRVIQPTTLTGAS